MIGMDRNTGKRIEGIPYLRQRMQSLLTMRFKQSIMRPKKGCNLYQLIDRPLNEAGVSELIFAALDAFDKPEDNGLRDFDVEKITLTPNAQGRATFNVYGTYLPDDRAVELKGLQI